jgi:ribosomal protein S4
MYNVPPFPLKGFTQLKQNRQTTHDPSRLIGFSSSHKQITQRIITEISKKRYKKRKKFEFNKQASEKTILPPIKPLTSEQFRNFLNKLKEGNTNF